MSQAEIRKGAEAVRILEGLPEQAQELLQDQLRRARIEGRKEGREAEKATPTFPRYEGALVIANAFALGMLPEGGTVQAKILSPEQARNLAQWAEGEGEGVASAVGHESTAILFEAVLGVKVAPNRVTVTLEPGQRILVGSLGVRLPEGKVLTWEELDAFPVTWYQVTRIA